MDTTTPQAAAYRFGRFTLDLARVALPGDGGAEQPLPPKSFALLGLLVENAGRPLDRDTIVAAVCPDAAAPDEAITECVRDIRKALGDEAQRLLRAAPRSPRCRSRTWAATRRPAGSPTGSPRTRSPTSPTSATST
ncbi:winged helix-turn-helix domain-containing protein [Benzoatithermus flavus]|uniref:Winged helix-turn-helix domain-containing protein n=1 Tax=Benzoatithermus flavus TaxID=3108223 RepID=A0ABU8XPY7_9PROT